MGLKQSRYNFFFDGDGGAKLAFNSMTAALAEIEPDKWPIIQKLLDDPNRAPLNETEKELLEQLKYGGFLIDEDFDEIAYLKVMNRMARFSRDSLGLTICPTLNCNFRCFYCYETHPQGVMSKEVQDKLVDFAKERLEGSKSFQVTWYGGEPLLAFDVIENLSERFIEYCDERGIDYSAFIVTNGYLLTPDKAKRLAELRVSGAQITLDGPPEVHDKRRVLANGGPTFWRIMENLKSALGFIPNITIRINVDKENRPGAVQLLEILENEGLKRKVEVNFAKTDSMNPVYVDEKGTCFNRIEYEEEMISFLTQAHERGWPLWSPVSPRISMCQSIMTNSNVVTPEGRLFKCWVEEFESPNAHIGSLWEENPMNSNLLKWNAWDPFEDTECRECRFLPLCMGGCTYRALHKEKACEWTPESLEKGVKAFCKHQSNQGEREDQAAKNFQT
ncbi:MAG: radical SAM protein [candidate division WOR-3 bacterium]